MQKIFTFDFPDNEEIAYGCNGTDCREKTYAVARIHNGNTHHTFRFCKKHFEEFKQCVDEDYPKIEKVYELEEEQKKELERKKKELFGE